MTSASTTPPSDDYFGTLVEDPFRGLEDTHSAATAAWLAEQSARSESYFAALPARERIAACHRALLDFERIGVPVHVRDTFMVAKNSGLQNQAVLYVSAGAGEPERVLIDPNGFSADGTVALADTQLSHDGKRLAYALQNAGSDWMVWHVRDVASGVDLADRSEWSKFSSAAWSADDAGFYYGAFDRPVDGDPLADVNRFQKLYYHRLGTLQSDDPLIWRCDEEPDRYASADTTDDGRFLIVYERTGFSNNGVKYRDLSRPDSQLVELFADGVASYGIVDNGATHFYARTTRDAPNGRLVRVDLARPHDLVDVIPETTDLLEAVTSVGGCFFARYLHDAHARVIVFDHDGKRLGEVPLPGVGSVTGFGGVATDTKTYFSFSSFTTPATIYRFEIASGTVTVFAQPRVAFDFRAYHTEQIFATSRDGARVPLFVTRAAHAARDEPAATILYGYGGFNVNLTPAFSPEIAQWLALGGTFAVATLRGGGEYGEAWHLAGARERKQNVFDDFIAAADHLVAHGHTAREKLALSGGSNGGLLVGAVMTQRPQLARAVLCDVGLLDMLRYDKFTIGRAWTPEYGSAETSEAEFRTLFAYSPLHNVRAGVAYPATLISTADHDDRVFPAHSYKFAAALQAAQAGPEPILLYVQKNAGHGLGKPLTKIIEEVANRYAFLAEILGLEVRTP